MVRKEKNPERKKKKMLKRLNQRIRGVCPSREGREEQIESQISSFVYRRCDSGTTQDTYLSTYLTSALPSPPQSPKDGMA